MGWVDLAGWIGGIPATFWGVIIGSIFTLIGVVATNWHAGRRLKVQLDHERMLKGKERELALRKDIYLSATEAIAEGMNLIMRFPDLELSPEKLTQRFNEKAAAMAKVHVIARESTVKCFVAFTTEFNASVLKLSAKRTPFLEKQQEISSLIEQSNSVKIKRDQLLEIIRQMNIEGIQNSKRFTALESDFEEQHSRAKEIDHTISAFQNELRKSRLKYIHECMLDLHTLRELLLHVLAEVREELEVPIDLKNYSTIMSDGHTKETAFIKSFIEENSTK